MTRTSIWTAMSSRSMCAVCAKNWARTASRPAAARVMSSADRHHTGSLEQTLQWTLGGLVVAALLALTGAALWIGREGAEQFVASRLAHDAEVLIAGIDPQNRKVGGAASACLQSAVLRALLLGAIRKWTYRSLMLLVGPSLRSGCPGTRRDCPADPHGTAPPAFTALARRVRKAGGRIHGRRSRGLDTAHERCRVPRYMGLASDSDWDR
jgi:hypothetical protein